MNRTFGIVISAIFAAFVAAPAALAAPASCKSIITLRPASSSSRGGRIIYKSNSNASGRDTTFSQGNHSQAGPAILFHYRGNLFPNSNSIKAMDLNGKTIASGFRRPRCTPQFGCGEFERWYFGFNSAAGIKSRSTKGSMLIQARGNTCIRVNNVLSPREEG